MALDGATLEHLTNDIETILFGGSDIIESDLFSGSISSLINKF